MCHTCVQPESHRALILGNGVSYKSASTPLVATELDGKQVASDQYSEDAMERRLIPAIDDLASRTSHKDDRKASPTKE